jgi:SAM-dependent methyltransferase
MINSDKIYKSYITAIIMSNQLKALHDNVVHDSNVSLGVSLGVSLVEYLLENENRYIESINKQIQNKDESWKAIKGTGYFRLSAYRLLDAINYLKQEDMIKSKANFLDMGCGLGLNSIAAASQGLNVYGIEINQVLVEGAKQIMQKSKEDKIIDSQSICKIVQGNYFPEEYRILRQNNQSEAVFSEQKHYEDSTYRWKSISSVSIQPKAFLYPKIDAHDAYKELDVSLKDIDIMYCYCWAINVPSIFEIFSKYTRNDAILLLASGGMPRDTNKLLEKFNLNFNFGKTPYHKNSKACEMDIVTKDKHF